MCRGDVDVSDIVAMCRSWSSAEQHRTTVHVFAEPATFRELRKHPSARNDRWGLHSPYDDSVSNAQADPADAAAPAGPAGGGPVGGADPWFGWIRRSLAGQAVDVIQLVNRGTVAGGSGGVSLLQGGSAGEKVRRVVGAAEVAALMTGLGAWGLLLAGTRSRSCLPGLRELADAVARMVPATVLLHDPTSDAGGREFVRAVRIVGGGADGVEEQLPSLTCWVHPSFLDVPDAARSRLLVAADGRSELFGAHTVEALAEADTPTWIASSSRFLEVQQSRWLGDEGPSGDDGDAAADPAVAAALSSVAGLLDRHAARYLAERGQR